MPILTGLRNVLFDSENDVVFVLNKLAYKIGGAPGANAMSVAGDFRQTMKAVGIWAEFKARHSAYVDRAGWTDKGGGEHRLADILEGTEEAAVKQKKRQHTGKRTQTATQKDADKLLARYTEELDDESREYVFRVWRHLSTSLVTGKPMSLERRLKILRRWDKEPALKIAIAAVEFVEGGCMETGKRDDYFLGIVGRSATSKFIEYQNDQDKKLEGMTR